MRLNKDAFSDDNSNTVGIEFVTKTMTVDEEEVKAQIWDTAGQERFSSMMGTYYRKAKGALLLFSVTDRQSFEDAEGWYQQIMELGEEGTMVLLVGNKCDVDGSARVVSAEDAKAFAASHKMQYIETSAKSGHNVARAFQTTVERKNSPRRVLWGGVCGSVPERLHVHLRVHPNSSCATFCRRRLSAPHPPVIVHRQMSTDSRRTRRRHPRVHLGGSCLG